MCFFLLLQQADAQNWNTNTAAGNNLSGFGLNNILGTSGTTFPIPRRNIRFFTNGGERMRLIGVPGPTLGFLGIGLTNPQFRLDVQDNINVNTPTIYDGYRILGQRFLTMPGGVGGRNTFVGISGNTTLLAPASDNTYVGFNVGANSTGTSNRSTMTGSQSGFNNQASGSTFYGYGSGQANLLGDFNTFVGTFSGAATTNGSNNAFLGFRSGFINVLGSSNVFVGPNSGPANLNGNSNVFLGRNSGLGNVDGSNNIAIGELSGATLVNTTRNILVGFSADITAGVTNGTAIGNAAVVTTNNTMILGANNINVGIGLSGITPGPQDKLEINSGTSCVSGLQFRQLTSTCAPVVNPGQGVLAVDPNGKVIYVSAPTSGIASADNGLTISGTTVQLGNGLCNGTGQFTSNREIPMNNFNLYFNDAVGNTGSIYIGDNTGCGPILTRLDVTNSSKQGAGAFRTTFSAGGTVLGLGGQSQNTGTGGSIGLSGSSLGTTGTGSGIFCIGVAGRSASSSSPQNIGVNGIAANATNYSIAGNFDVIQSSSPNNYGVQIEVINNSGSVLNYGGQFIVSGNPPASVDYGVYSSCGPSSGNTPPTGPKYAGFFNGDLAYTGTFGFVSDQRIKKDVKDMRNALDIIGKLEPKTYTFDQSVYPQLNLSGAKQYGFIAQEVEAIMPELILPIHQPEMYDTNGVLTSEAVDLKGLNYQAFIPLLMQGMKEQQTIIEQQQEQLQKLQEQMDMLLGTRGDNGTGAVIPVELSDRTGVVLNQNVPNPFAEQTTIRYFVPESSGSVQILFYNNLGQMIRAVDVREKGEGRLVVYANDLSAGVYSYSLLIDGKVIETRRMTKTE